MGYDPLEPGSTGDRLSVIIRKCNEMFSELYEWLSEPLRNLGYGLITIFPGCAGVVDVDFLAGRYQTINVDRPLTFRTLNRKAGRSCSLRMVNTTSSAQVINFEPGTRALGHLPVAAPANVWSVLSFTAYGDNTEDVLIVYAAQLDAPVTGTLMVSNLQTAGPIAGQFVLSWTYPAGMPTGTQARVVLVNLGSNTTISSTTLDASTTSNWTLPSVPPENYRIDVTLIDASNSPLGPAASYSWTVTGDYTVSNFRTAGPIAGQTYLSWDYPAGMPTNALAVINLVDTSSNSIISTTTLATSLGASWAFPTEPSGVYRVDVTLIDPYNYPLGPVASYDWTV